jgi:hypothetical protein
MIVYITWITTLLVLNCNVLLVRGKTFEYFLSNCVRWVIACHSLLFITITVPSTSVPLAISHHRPFLGVHVGGYFGWFRVSWPNQCRSFSGLFRDHQWVRDSTCVSNIMFIASSRKHDLCCLICLAWTSYCWAMAIAWTPMPNVHSNIVKESELGTIMSPVTAGFEDEGSL